MASTVLRASRLFDGTSSALIQDPVVVLDGATIVSVDGSFPADAEVVAAMTHAARTALLGGVTTVRDLGDRDYLSLQLRDQPGLPTIVAAGPPITTPGGHCHYLGGATTDVRAAVREHAERGCDVIKIMASGGMLTPGTRQEISHFDLAELTAAVDEAFAEAGTVSVGWSEARVVPGPAC